LTEEKHAEEEERADLLYYRRCAIPTKSACSARVTTGGRSGRIAWNACSDKERQMLMYPEPLQTLGDRQVDNLMRVALQVQLPALIPILARHQRNPPRLFLQGLCVNIETQQAQDPAAAFQMVDKDGSGTVDYAEFCNALRWDAYAFTPPQDF